MSRSGESQVDVCLSDAGFVLSIGSVSISLDRSSAEEILLLLALALAADHGEDVTRRPSN